MDKQALFESAQSISAPPPQTAAHLERVAKDCAEELTHNLKQRNDITSLIGDGNIPLMETNHVNHFRYMASLASLYDPIGFVETVLWVFRTYRPRGFTPQYWEVMLPECKRIIHDRLEEPHAHNATALYDWLHAHIADFTTLSDTSESFFESVSTLHGDEDDKPTA